MTRAEMEKLKRLLQAIFPKYKSMTNEERDGWYLVLKPFKYDDCRKAVTDFAQTSPFAPTVGEIASIVKERTRFGMDAGEAYRQTAAALARVLEVDPPTGTLDEITEWFEKVRRKR